MHYQCFQHWSFLVFCITWVCCIAYVWLPGYVEFDNIKEQVIIKRYQYKFSSSKVIPYSEVSGIELNFNQNITEFGETYLIYFFKLKLRNGNIQPMFSLVDKQKTRKIKTWISRHVDFDFEFKSKRLKKKKPLFRFEKNNG